MIVADSRNHGQSFHSPDMNYVLMAEDVSNLMKRLSVRKFNLLGHSMGGKTAMLLALTQVRYRILILTAEDISICSISIF